MDSQPTRPDQQDPIGAWLTRAGLANTAIPTLIEGCAERLNADGYAVSRMVVGLFTLHPLYSAVDYTWTVEAGTTRCGEVPRQAMSTARFQDSPFFALASTDRHFDRLRLTVTGCAASGLLADIAASGITDYCVFYEPFETRAQVVDWRAPERLIHFREGVLGAVGTRRPDGFAAAQVTRLRALFPVLGLAVRAHASHRLAETMLDTYLGARTGTRVLSGQIRRGDGEAIQAVIMITDLRASTVLSARLPIDAYLATINRYFDCTAGAVLAHGGEVLKFIGDGVLAIFPFAAYDIPAAAAAQAIRVARDMLARLAHLNRNRAGEVPLEIGIALHAGEVLYGNVGTERRLDFTVVGAAVNEAAKLEALCKSHRVPVVASARFNDLCGSDKLLRLDAPWHRRAPPVFTLPIEDVTSG